ncbi:MAG TPA: SH3 domain-containing protein [Candidatus Rifleibacterium sp.]|nr:SH3 domain-containing protein [Candidatus Rifleibacterium sp.]HPT46166.1 SH3 domain-containing protein [Candidatus Rifleibacterium sp.]
MKTSRWFFCWLLVLSICLTVPGGTLMAQSAADVFGDNAIKITTGTNSSASGEAAAATGKGTLIGTVRVDPSLNVRTGPWGEIIGSLYDGNKVEIIGSDGDWYKINYGSGVAYVHSDYVVVGDAAATASSSSSTGTVHVSPSLNIRTSPWGNVVGSFYEGDQVNIIGQEGDWYKISWNGQTVYCHTDFISKNGAGTSSQPAVSQPTSSGVQTGANGLVKMEVPKQCQGAVNCPYPWSACGPTSLGMALAYYGKGNAGALAANLWNVCGSTGDAGTNHAGLVRGAANYGFPNAKWSYSVGASWVREQIKAGKPVIANVYNHYVVITGIDDSGNIYYNDPAKWDVVQVKSYDSFSAWWNGGGCYHAAMTLQ